MGKSQASIRYTEMGLRVRRQTTRGGRRSPTEAQGTFGSHVALELRKRRHARPRMYISRARTRHQISSESVRATRRGAQVPNDGAQTSSGTRAPRGLAKSMRSKTSRAQQLAPCVASKGGRAPKRRGSCCHLRADPRVRENTARSAHKLGRCAQRIHGQMCARDALALRCGALGRQADQTH